MTERALRLAVVGGRRGGSFNLALSHLGDRLALTAVCDPDEAMRDRWREAHPGIHAYEDFHRMLADDVCDAVLLATPMQVHADQAEAALHAGKHVLSEVTACVTHEEAVRLVEAVEATGLTYMMAENYTYRRPHMAIRHMVDQGVFGELTYAEGMYIHDCRHLKFKSDGALTWRGELARDMIPCNYYPTHSFGPIAQWMGIGQTDQIDTVFCASYPGRAMARYARQHFGESHPGTEPSYWRRGDGAQCLVTTRKGRLISLRVDSSSGRPHHMTVHELQGTGACYRTQARAEDDPLFWIDGQGDDWIEWSALRERYDHPRWAAWGEVASQAGHGGGDFFILQDFVAAIEGTAPNPIDVYDAVTWSSLIWLGAESARTGRAIKAIDYRDADQRRGAQCPSPYP